MEVDEGMVRKMVLSIDPDASDDDLNFIVPIVVAREVHLRALAAAQPGSTEWEAAARDVDGCEAVMSHFGLLERGPAR